MSVNYENYFKCPFCGYNNAKKRLEWKKQCLKCGKQLVDSNISFKIKLIKRLEGIK